MGAELLPARPEDLDETLELDLQIRGQQPKVRDALPEDLAPRVGKRPAAKPRAPRFDQQRLAREPAGDEQREADYDQKLQAPPYPSSVIDAA